MLLALASFAFVIGCDQGPDLVGPPSAAVPDLSGPISHVRTYVDGPIWYLERVDGTDTSRIGLQSQWGASIVEASLNRRNFINSYDAGREIQLSLYEGGGRYDACAGCTGTFGWNPVQGGDRYGNGSAVLSHSMAENEIYARIHPNQWYPNDKGGGRAKPVPSDVYFEQWVSAVPNKPRTFKVSVRITHFGSDEHPAARQEFPAVFGVRENAQFVYYGGAAPWTGDEVAQVALPRPDQGVNVRGTEPWGSLVDAEGQGVTVFIPGDYGYFNPGMSTATEGGPKGKGYNYFAPFASFGLAAGEVYEGEYYVIVGDHRAARQAIYSLQRELAPTDRFSPTMNVETPVEGATTRGTTWVAGWAFDNLAVAGVEVYVDGAVAGQGTIGYTRPDVSSVWLGAPANSGFRYALDTTKLQNGVHELHVKVTDGSGRSISRTRTFVVAN
jgi:hypothetical protein